MHAVHLSLFALRLPSVSPSRYRYDILTGSSGDVGPLGYFTIKVQAQQMGGREEKESDSLKERGFEKEGGMPGREKEATQNRVHKNECGS